MGNQFTKKQKRALLLVGITGAVYLSFKYLLPLVIPFLIAYLIALGLRPLTRWLKRKFHIKESISSVLLVLLLMGALFLILWIIGRQLVIQGVKLVQYLPDHIDMLQVRMGDVCGKIEKTLFLGDGVIMELVDDLSVSFAESVTTKVLPYLMSKSMPILKGVVQAAAILVVTITATLLSLKEMDHFSRMRERSSFRTEIALVSRRLSMVGGAYMRTQGIILSITIAVCMGGFTIMGNTYSVLLGVLIGLLDALPIFGTGTVLIPWALLSALSGNIYHTLILCVIFLVCSFTREILEAKLMGKSMGITALESLMAMYVGLQLFGLAGLILGPIAFLVIRELVLMYS